MTDSPTIAFPQVSNPSESKQKGFALVGAAGFVAPRHMKAIRDTGNQLLAAVDPHDSVGILDSYFPDARFFTEIERFDRFLDKNRRRNCELPVDYVSICSPNYLHDAHVRLALRSGATAICEKPLVINPWNLDQLVELEQDHPGNVRSVLQLRYHPAVQALREKIQSEHESNRPQISLTYVTRRGAWYQSSWKGSIEQSGGVAMNIGIHFFDLLIWLFGDVKQNNVHLSESDKLSGTLEFERATASWYLSIDADDLPQEVREKNGHAYRSLAIDGEELDLSAGFNDLHTSVYRDIIDGGGFGIEDARPAIDLVYQIRKSEVASVRPGAHHFLTRTKVA